MAWNDRLTAQYLAATTSALSVQLVDWTTLSITGADRASFLHNMCTNDIRSLPVGGQCEAFLTDVKGKIIGHVIVLAEADQLLLLTVPGQADKLIAHLSRYIIREDVQLNAPPLSLEWTLVVGPHADDRLNRRANDRSLEPSNRGFIHAPCLQIWPGGYWFAVAGEPGLPLLAENSCDEQIWHALRIESGWPLFGVDFDDSNLPQEVGRDAQAISFRKGCYLGQETVARIDALGHVNKKLATVQLGGEAAAGAELSANGSVVGSLSSVAWSPRLDAWLGLAMIRRGHNEPDAQLTCESRPAEVVPTPAVVA